MKSILTLFDLNNEEIMGLIDQASEIKKNPAKYANEMNGKVLLMVFEKPSTRTRISFDAAMKTLGGHVIVVESKYSTLGCGKESIEDFAKVSSRYVDIIMARMFEQCKLIKLAENATVPVINGLTDDFHPVQILSDLLTIKEKAGKFKGLRLCYLGDGNNNITHSLIIGCAHMGIDIFIGCPGDTSPKQWIVEKAKNITDAKIVITSDPVEAVKGADIIYTDSWMSFHIPESEKEKRVEKLKPYQVNGQIVKHAKKNYIFMHDLPAMRGCEVTSDIIDGPNSIVFDQAENRLHMQKSILMWCLK